MQDGNFSMKRILSLCIFWFGSLHFISGSSKPNIVLIMVDDLGVEALSCYDGDQYETPRIDALAKEGLVFERAFCTPVCTPTRVQLLTGRYPFNNGWDSGIWKKKEEAPDSPMH